METVRSFVAVELPGGLKTALSQTQSKLKTDGQGFVRFVDTEGIHLTLKFLGNVAVGRLEGVQTAMAEAARGLSPFTLEVKGLGAFPNVGCPRVVWVGVGGEVGVLSELQQRLDSRLASRGFATEKRTFTPHLTLGRLRERASAGERAGFGRLVAGTEFPAYSFTVLSLSLMKSQLTREGAVYTRLHRVGLGERLSTESG